MKIIDNTKNCIIYNRSFMDDMLPYTLTGDSSSASIEFPSSTYPITDRLSPLLDIINGTVPDSILQKNIWYPIIIYDDTLVTTKKLSNDGAIVGSNPNINSGRIGIEDFFEFQADTNKWDIGSNKMCIDWILNRSDFPHMIQYGLLAWVRSNQTNSSQVFGGGSGPITDFPNYSRISSTTDSDTIYIKIDNETLFNTDTDASIFAASNTTMASAIEFADGDGFVKVSSLGTNPQFQLNSDRVVENRKRNTTSVSTSSGFNGFTLWIPDGDCFSYYRNKSSFDTESINSIVSKDYVSPSLYSKYNSIYNTITKLQRKDFGFKSLKKSRLYKKLAKYLSSSPFITQFCIEALGSDEIRTIINSYLSSTFTNPTDDRTKLVNTLLQISTKIQSELNAPTVLTNPTNSLDLDIRLTNETINGNIVNNVPDLFSKLINKYGCRLKLTGSPTLTYTGSLTHGDGAIVSQIQETYCDKNLTNANVWNNQVISFNTTNIQIKTDLGFLKGKIDFYVDSNKKLTAHLYDTIKPRIDDNFEMLITMSEVTNVKGINMNDGNNDQTPADKISSPDNIVFRYGDPFPSLEDLNKDVQSNVRYPEFKVFELGENNLDIVRDSPYTPANLEAEKQIFCFWEKIYGPPMKFIDNNKNPKKLYDTATSRVVSVVPSGTGRYIIQCTCVTPFGKFIITKLFYIVDGRQRLDVGGGGFVANTNYLKLSNPIYDDYGQVRYETVNYDEFLTIDTLQINAEKIAVRPDRSNIRVNICDLNRVAIHKAGIFWPIKTNFKVERIYGSNDQRAIEPLEGSKYKFFFRRGNINSGNTTFSIQYLCNNTTIKLERIGLENLRDETQDCSQCQSICDTKLIGYPFTRLGQPPSLSYYRDDGTFTLQSYTDTPIIPDSTGPMVDYPGFDSVSTDYAPWIKTYGGYNKSIIDTLGVTIPGASKPLPNFLTASNAAELAVVLPTITGYKLDNKNTPTALSSNPTNGYKLCYQKALDVIDESYAGKDSFIEFKKGVFHPTSGWLSHDTSYYNDYANTCSVLKFNPGARDSFGFSGPGIFGFTSVHSMGTGNDILIQPNIYSSSIKIDIAPGVRWSPRCECPLSDNSTDAERKAYDARGTAHEFINQAHKEFVDQYGGGPNAYHHGYRILGGGMPKLSEQTSTDIGPTMDEFIFSSQNEVNDAQFNYSFTVTGPPNKINTNVNSDLLSTISNASVPQGSEIQPSSYLPRDPRVNTFTIKDIEVKLNFLNYINTKDLIVWLEVEPCAAEKRRQNPRSATVKPAPITADMEYIDQTFHPSMQNTSGVPGWANIASSNSIPSGLNYANVGNYLQSLTNMNSSASPGSNFKIFLLNQEHVSHNGYNFTVKFSDNAFKNTTRYFSEEIAYGQQNQVYGHSNENPVETNGVLSPTLSALGYSESDSNIYSKIIHQNNLYITNNQFSKLKNKPLFMNPGPEEGPCGREGLPKQKDVSFDSYTKFILKIAVVDDPDDMTVYDTLVNNSLYTNFETIEKEQKSSDMFKSLCNWELILHVNETKQPISLIGSDLSTYGNVDALSLIEYGKDPKYPGYSFIANLANKKFLLPFANINAPNVYFQDYNLCHSSDPDLIGTTVIKGPPKFPAEAALLIAAGLAAGTVSGTLVGTLTGPTAGYYLGFQQIIDFFYDLRFYRDLDRRLGNIYNINYKNFGFGSPEKIMLNISKDGCFWYKVEASIFKYQNTPILKNNKYKFVRLKRNNVPALSEFSFEYITSLDDLVDELFIKDISLNNCSDFGTYSSQAIGDINGTTLIDGDIFRVSIKNSTSSGSGSGGGNSGGGSGSGSGCECNNGLYIVINGVWFKLDNSSDTCSNPTYPSKILSSYLYTQFNSVLGFNKSIFNTLSTSISNKKLIIINSRIPFDIFSINDPIEIYKDSTRNTSSDIQTSTILNKAKILKNNTYHTVLELADSPGTNDILCGLGDTIVVYKDNTTVNGKKEIPFGEWSFEKRDVDHNIPDISFSTNSIGSYGDGSPSVSKNILTYEIKRNRLDKLYDIFNHHNNQKYKYNKLVLKQANTTNVYNISGKTAGFAYDVNEIKTVLSTQRDINKVIRGDDWPDSRISPQKNNDQHIENLENLLDNIQYKIPNSWDVIKNIMYIKNPNISGNSIPTGCLYGEITIQNDYVLEEPTKIEFASGASITTLNDRLRTLEYKINSESGLDSFSNAPTWVDASIGNANSNFVFTGPYSSIKQTQDHYDIIATGINQYPEVRQALLDKYAERDNIIEFFNDHAERKTTITYATGTPPTSQTVTNADIVSENYSSISVSYTPAFDPGVDSDTAEAPAPTGLVINKDNITSRSDSYSLRNTTCPGSCVLPKKQVKISIVDNQHVFEYTNINDDYYWINIDPKQSCSLAEELRPRVLKSTKYSCTLLNPVNTLLTVDNNVCPQFASFGDTKVDNGGVEDFTGTAGEFTYTIPEGTVTLKKNDLEAKYGNSIAKWKEIFIDRTFYLYSDQDLSPFNNTEFIVSVRETYDVAVPRYETMTTQEAIDAGLIKTDYTSDTIAVPGIPGDGACNVDVSPPGIGLVTDGNGGRTGKPTRVHNIFNLDDTTSLKVKFRKMPRQIRGIDLLGTVFRYGKNGLYRQLNPGNPIVPIDMGSSEHQINNLYVWECLQKATNGTLEKTSVPDFFKVMNEMMFRAFYGSVDEIEIKSDGLTSSYTHDMIPYEYFNKPPPPPPAT